MNLLPPNEQVLFQSPGGGLILTSHRIRYQMQVGGNSTLISIMLEEVASCGIARVRHTVLLAIAALSLILGTLVSLSSRGYGAFIVGFVLALVLIGIYFASRQQILVVASAGSTIRANVVDMEPETVIELINQLEFAKNSRYFAVQRAG